jgi:hypothetical protein
MKRFRALMQGSGGRSMSPMRDADVFWSDFRSRAKRTAQQAPVPAAVTALRWAALASPMAAAALAMLLLRPLAASWMQSDTVINALEVEAAHRAVFIMNDEPTRSTIVWVDWGPGTQSNGGRR